MIALDYSPADAPGVWLHACDVHPDDLRDELASWCGTDLCNGDLVRAVGDGHESLYVMLDSALREVRDEHGPLTASQWEGDAASAAEMLQRCARVDRRRLVLAACDCAETTLRYVPAEEERPRIAIETARRWVRGEAGVEDVRRAADAAWTAYVDAAASGATRVATFDAATRAAAFASYAASYAAASYAAAVWLSARTSSLRSMAPLVRRHIPLAVIARAIVEHSLRSVVTTKNLQERRTYGDLNECVLGHMAHHMHLCLMRPAGEPRPDAPVIQKLLDLVKEQLT